MEIVQATEIDAVQLRCRTRIAERVYAAGFAEPVFCDFRAGLIQGEGVLPRQQPESFGRDPVMDRALLGANRAIAFRNPVENGCDLETDSPTVTTALVSLHI